MEAEPEEATPPIQLPLFTNLHTRVHSNSSNMFIDSPERSGTETPPLQAVASVPFHWEEEPGKPRQCNDTTTTTTTTTNTLSKPSAQKCLHLPPRLLLLETYTKTKKLHSPTTLLDSPYSMFKSSPFKSSSFRIISKDLFSRSFRRSTERGSARFVYGDNRSTTATTPMMFGKEVVNFEKGSVASLGWTRRLNFTANRDGFSVSDGGSNAKFTGYLESENDDFGCFSNEDITRRVDITRSTGRFSNHSQSNKSQFWATIYGSLKQVVPWRSKKHKKDGHGSRFDVT